mmetsp:Transcript_1033/g.2243  ORF Transcript_1033/g.2243 Transcript_1033/m.2243 type:complete len:380 (-) Transcript_1033:114-1253(-)
MTAIIATLDSWTDSTLTRRQPTRISKHNHQTQATMTTSRLIVIAATTGLVVSCFIFSATPGMSFAPPVPSRTNGSHQRKSIFASLLTASERRTKRKTKDPQPTRLRFSVEDVVEQLASTEVQSLKQELYDLASKTNRGFTANAMERRAVSEIVFDLARFNQSREPAQDYYHDGRGVNSGSGNGSGSGSNMPSNSVKGKWQLIYTDAPDIVSLDSSKNPFSTAKLGRIGQECSPPYIKNVIEWFRPDWAKDLPYSGTDESRVLQKVVTAASATPTKPMVVDLKVAGFELEAGMDVDDDHHDHHDGLTTAKDNNDWMSRIRKDGLPAGLLSLNPVDLKGPMNPLPFGQFEILYLDEEVRMIRTGQNYLAVNRRLKQEEEWF